VTGGTEKVKIWTMRWILEKKKVGDWDRKYCQETAHQAKKKKMVGQKPPQTG